MKETLLLGVFLLCSIFITTTEIPFQEAEIKSIMRKVMDWQIANPHPAPECDDLNWPQGAFYVDMVDWAELAEKEDGDDAYYKWLTHIGRRNYWQPDKRFYHADDITVSRSLLNLYCKYKDGVMVVPTLARIGWIINYPSKGSFKLMEGDLETLECQTWCDVLFMTPPVYAKLYMLTGDKRYIKFMNREYKATYDYLSDKEKNLSYHNWRYFDKHEANGKEVFQGCGSGWVLGGLVEVLKELPKKDKNRRPYEELFVKLAMRVAELQHPDSFWRASLLDPASYPSSGTSYTIFMVYSIAYGINEGLLDKGTYLPVMIEGWKALVLAVRPDGELGYVRQIGADPKKVTRDMTEVYGIGTLLMVGSETYKMVR